MPNPGMWNENPIVAAAAAAATSRRFTFPAAIPITALFTAIVFQRVPYDPSGGTFTINAPAAPVQGDRWGVKNETANLTIVTINGNGNNIEDPTASFALAANFTLSGDGIAAEWEFDGTNWVVV